MVKTLVKKCFIQDIKVTTFHLKYCIRQTVKNNYVNGLYWLYSTKDQCLFLNSVCMTLCPFCSWWYITGSLKTVQYTVVTWPALIGHCLWHHWPASLCLPQEPSDQRNAKFTSCQRKGFRFKTPLSQILVSNEYQQ